VMPIPKRDSLDRELLRRKVARRVLPFLFILYVVAYLDRANIAFARVPMTRQLGFSDAVYGLGAGTFFLGYFLLEIPGALIVERWGARRWICRILVTWGIVTVLFAFIKTPGQFYAGRFLLGVAEAGFFPGVIVYLTHWFRESDRSRALAGFMIAAPVALVLGAPVSALTLHLNWLGVVGWRWIFILQGLPAILLGIVTLWYLTDSPRDAHWLDAAERESIQEALDLENKRSGANEKWWSTLGQRDVLLLCSAHAFANIAGYGFIFWLPGTIKTAMRLSAGKADAISALPFACAVASIWLLGHSSDRTGKPKLHACAPMFCGAVFFALSAVPGQPAAVVLGWLCLTAACVFGWLPGFWTLPTGLFTGPSRAASVGLINSVGNLGGFIGPALIGYLLTTGSPRALVFLVSLSYCAAGGLTACVHLKRRQRS